MKNEEQNTQSRRRRLGTWAALAAVSAGVVFLAFGCGQHQDETATTGSGATEGKLAAETAPAPAAVPAASQGTASLGAGPIAGEEAVSIDSLPPDVVASVTNTLVEPGQIIEVAAQGSSDVTEIGLSDGGKTHPLTYDSGAGLWRTYYRVPLRTTTDRVALSVTAKNRFERWHRVWIFLTVDKGETTPDSVSGK